MSVKGGTTASAGAPAALPAMNAPASALASRRRWIGRGELTQRLGVAADRSALPHPSHARGPTDRVYVQRPATVGLPGRLRWPRHVSGCACARRRRARELRRIGWAELAGRHRGRAGLFRARRALVCPPIPGAPMAAIDRLGSRAHAAADERCDLRASRCSPISSWPWQSACWRLRPGRTPSERESSSGSWAGSACRSCIRSWMQRSIRTSPQPWTWFAINGSYHALGILIVSVIVAVWQ